MSEWIGKDLGTRTVTYDETRAILYALAVGADASDLDLVFEERLRVLPTFALTLAQWALDALGAAGAFDTGTAVHGTQRLHVLKDLPRSGAVEMSARVAEVWDKGSAAVFDVAVESEHFEPPGRCSPKGARLRRRPGPVHPQAPRGNAGRLADGPDGPEPGRPLPPPRRRPPSAHRPGDGEDGRDAAPYPARPVHAGGDHAPPSPRP